MRIDMACKDLCHNYYLKKVSANRGLYANGVKRCQVCETYLVWEGLWCPCCNNRLRSKPKKSSLKQIHEAKMKLKETKNK